MLVLRRRAGARLKRPAYPAISWAPLLLVAACARDARPEGGASASAADDRPPELHLPVPAGRVVLCQQGNRSPAPRSHAYPNTLFALDLSTPSEDPPMIVAAARGVVASVETQATPRESVVGYGFGNHVKLAHGGGYFTLYAHLATVHVKPGDLVEEGAPLGLMGDTGLAGNPHVHLSLHRGDGARPGVEAPAVPMTIRAWDLDGPAPVLRAIESERFVCAASVVSSDGHLYGSDNGRAPVDLATELGRHGAAVARNLVSHDKVEEILRASGQGGAREARTKLDALVAREPLNWEARYWIVVFSLRDLDDLPRAKEVLGEILEGRPREPPWIAPWLEIRLGQVAEKEGNLVEAQRRYRRAETHAVVTGGELGKEFEQMARDGAARTRPADAPRHARIDAGAPAARRPEYP